MKNKTQMLLTEKPQQQTNHKLTQIPNRSKDFIWPLGQQHKLPKNLQIIFFRQRTLGGTMYLF